MSLYCTGIVTILLRHVTVLYRYCHNITETCHCIVQVSSQYYWDVTILCRYRHNITGICHYIVQVSSQYYWDVTILHRYRHNITETCHCIVQVSSQYYWDMSVYCTGIVTILLRYVIILCRYRHNITEICHCIVQVSSQYYRDVTILCRYRHNTTEICHCIVRYRHNITEICHYIVQVSSQYYWDMSLYCAGIVTILLRHVTVLCRYYRNAPEVCHSSYHRSYSLFSGALVIWKCGRGSVPALGSCCRVSVKLYNVGIAAAARSMGVSGLRFESRPGNISIQILFVCVLLCRQWPYGRPIPHPKNHPKYVKRSLFQN
jgi:hypothetical protein